MAIIRDTEPFSKAYPPAPAPPAFSATAALTSFQPSTSSLLTDSFRSGSGLDPSLSRSTWMQAGAAPSAPSILGTSSPLSGSALDGQMARLAADQSRQLDLPQIDFRDNSLPLLSDSLTPGLTPGLTLGAIDMAPVRTGVDPAQRDSLAETIIDKHTNFVGNLDEEALGKHLGLISSDYGLVNRTFDKLGDSDRDDVGVEFTKSLSDQRLADIARDPEGKMLLERVARDMNTGSVYDDETAQVARITRATAPKYAPLLDESLPQAAKDSLKANNLTLQPLSDGHGRIHFDDHRVRVKMPAGVTPEKFLRDMANDVNGSSGPEFKAWTEFKRRGDTSQDTKVGTIYDIDIYGPENGTVVVKDVAPDHFTVATVNNGAFKPYGEHPVYGNRSFGFEKNDDGTVTFYTRAADRFDFAGGETPGGELFAVPSQADTWRAWGKGVGDRIRQLGGESYGQSEAFMAQ